jgi:hypothetical protein
MSKVINELIVFLPSDSDLVRLRISVILRSIAS